MKSAVNEFELLEHCQCPLRILGSTAVPKHEFGARFSTAIGQIILRAFNGDIPAKSEIIRQLDAVREFNRLQPKKTRSKDTGPAYEARMTVATSILDLLRTHRVLQPVSRYRLKVNRIHVEGEYAVLQPANPKLKTVGVPCVLQIRTDDLSVFPDCASCPSNFISFARLSHFLSGYEYAEARVVNLHVPTGYTWVHGFTRSRAEQFVNSAVGSYVNLRRFPAPGTHCSSCKSRACMEAQ